MSTDLQKIVEQEGFESLDEFVRSNLHYLPKDRQRVFDLISGTKSKNNNEAIEYSESLPQDGYQK